MKTKVAALLVAIVALANDAQTIKVDVKVVNVLASVRDRNGRGIADLTKSDFFLEEDGRPQTIKYFAQQSDLPLSIGLMVDASGSQHRLLEEERRASISFIEQMVRPDRDRVFVLQFDQKVQLLQEFTDSPGKLRKAISRVPFGPTLWDYSIPVPSCGGRGTLLYEAVAYAAKDLMSRREGRKAMILLTDGVDNWSCASLDDVIEYLQRADTIVYGIYFVDRDSYRPYLASQQSRKPPKHREPTRHREVADGRKVVQRISGETGGRFFEIRPELSIEQIYSLVQQELRNQYNLGFSSDRTMGPAGYRKLRVSTKRPDLVVHARDGYYAR